MKEEETILSHQVYRHLFYKQTSRKTAAAAVHGVALDWSCTLSPSPHVAPVTRHANPNGCPRLYRGKLIRIFCILSSLCNNTTWHHMVDTQSQRSGWEMLTQSYLSGQVLLKHSNCWKSFRESRLLQPV